MQINNALKSLHKFKDLIVEKKYPIITSFLLLTVLATYHNCGAQSQESEGNSNSNGYVDPNIPTSAVGKVEEYSLNCFPRSGYNRQKTRIKCEFENYELSQSTRVRVNGAECLDISLEGENTLYCNIQPSYRTGLVDITAINEKNEKIVLENAFGYHNCKEQLPAEEKMTVVYSSNHLLNTFCGVAPYYTEIVSGNGHFNGSTLVFTAPDSDDETIIKQVDSVGTVHELTIITNPPPLGIRPFSNSFTPGATIILQPHGGVPPYKIAVDSNVGTESEENRVKLLTTLRKGNYVIKISDQRDNEVEFNFEVGELSISPVNHVMAAGTSLQIQVEGGMPSYTYKIVGSEEARINSYNGSFYTDEAGEYTITAIDRNGAKISTKVTVKPKMENTKLSTTVKVNHSQQLNIVGGVPPYTYELTNNSLGAVDDNGLFSAAKFGVTSIIVRDQSRSRLVIPVSIEPDIKVYYQDVMQEYGSQEITYSGLAEPATLTFASGRAGTQRIEGLTFHSDNRYTTPLKLTDANGYSVTFEISKREQDPMIILPWDAPCAGWKCTFNIVGAIGPVTVGTVEIYGPPEGAINDCDYMCSYEENNIAGLNRGMKLGETNGSTVFIRDSKSRRLIIEVETIKLDCENCYGMQIKQ